MGLDIDTLLGIGKMITICELWRSCGGRRKDDRSQRVIPQSNFYSHNLGCHVCGQQNEHGREYIHCLSLHSDHRSRELQHACGIKRFHFLR